MELTLARAPTEEIMLWASPPCNAGKRRNWDYRVLGLLQTPVEGANNFRRLYVKRFGVPPVGKRVFVRVRQQTNGWRASRGKAARLSPRGRADRGAEANGGAEERIEEYKRNTSGIRAEHRRNTSDQHAGTRLCARQARSNLPGMLRASSFSPSARVRGHGCLLILPPQGLRRRGWGAALRARRRPHGNQPN
jgi:hypothetical protein